VKNNEKTDGISSASTSFPVVVFGWLSLYICDAHPVSNGAFEFD